MLNKDNIIENEDRTKNETMNADSKKQNINENKDLPRKEKKNENDIYIEKVKNLEKESLIKEFENIYKKNQELTKKEEDNINYLDKYKRTLAEMENLRKRTINEKETSLKYANFNIISDFLVILDDFERAIESAKSDKKMDLKHFLQGIEMIEKQFVDLLFKKYGVVKYGEKGDEFDPQHHIGMTAEEGDYKTETIVDVFRKGYKLHDRVIRAAEVKVGKPKE